jgi:hypothetical protein
MATENANLANRIILIVSLIEEATNATDTPKCVGWRKATIALQETAESINGALTADALGLFQKACVDLSSADYPSGYMAQYIAWRNAEALYKRTLIDIIETRTPGWSSAISGYIATIDLIISTKNETVCNMQEI